MWEPQSIEHEVLGTEVCLCFPEATFIRGYEVDEEIKPDIEMYLKDEKFFIEIDTGKVSHTKQKRRWQKYEEFDGNLLVVTSTQKRIEGLIRYSEEIHEIALFTTFDGLFDNPQGAVWQNREGDLFSVD